MSTNASAACACSPVAGGVGLGDGVGVGEGVGVGDGAIAGSGLRDGPDRRRRVELGVSLVTFCNDEEDCALADASILAVELVGVAFCTTLQPTAKNTASAIRT